MTWTSSNFRKAVRLNRHSASGARAADIYKGENFSDHAPLTIAYDWQI